jgi:hypothetical protein
VVCLAQVDNAQATLKLRIAAMRKLNPIRIRFTIRLLFVITAVLAVALYVLYVRPTLIANRFVAAVMRCDFSTANSLLIGDELPGLDDETGTVEQIYAEVLPREWEDIFKCQRKIVVRHVHHQEEGGRRVDWTSDTDLVAGFHGRVVMTPVIDFSKMSCGMVKLPAYNEPLRIPDYTLVP